VATRIHPTAVVDPQARLAEGVEVGAYCVIGPHGVIGEGTVLHNHVTVMGHTALGARCQVFPGAVLGGPPQDLKYKGAPTTLEIGDQNILRECCTLNPGTELGGGRTLVGNQNLIMAYVHVAHDCRLHNQVVIANATQLAGHVHIYDGARLSGLAAVHHFVRIGRGAFVAGCAKLSIDVPPFTLAEGHPARIRTLNLEGLSRRGIAGDDLAALKKAFRLLFREKVLPREKAYEQIREGGWEKFPIVAEFVEFVRTMDCGVNGRGLEAQRKVLPPEQRDGRLAVGALASSSPEEQPDALDEDGPE
jgi:UDP-N-acetylglucosamine acyltransferase